MSGHSKWSTIKHKKAANDAVKGKIFSNLSKAITIAAKTGGGVDPDSNYKLRVVIDQARAENMPKQNIDRALSKAISSDENLEEITYEGFGPKGAGLLIKVVTNNKNRTVQEIKNILERGGGSLGSPGSVSFNFDLKSMIVIKKQADFDNQILSLIDAGVEEYEESNGAVEIYADPKSLFDLQEKMKKAGFEIIESSLTQKPKNSLRLEKSDSDKMLALIGTLEEHEDVQNVYTNALPHDH